MNERITIKVRECKLCGMRSVPWFGFNWPCLKDSMGVHRDTIEVEEDIESVEIRLKEVYDHALWFDRDNFNKSASDEVKAMCRG